jgi:hypothetical protein
MWKKLDNLNTITQIKSGNIISPDPDDKSRECVVQAILGGMIRIVTVKGISKILIFPIENLLSEGWVILQKKPE